jgi:hypothetical protein
MLVKFYFFIFIIVTLNIFRLALTFIFLQHYNPGV